MKANRFLLFILACILSIGTGWAGGSSSSTFYGRITGSAKKVSGIKDTFNTGDGVIYVTTDDNDTGNDDSKYVSEYSTTKNNQIDISNTVIGNSWKPTVKVFAKSKNSKWVFSYWDLNGTTSYDANTSFEPSITSTSNSNRTKVTVTAYFQRAGIVTLTSQAGGTAKFDQTKYITNTAGQTIYISAYGEFDKVFDGWYVNGERKSTTQKNYEVTVPNSDVVYEARWKDVEADYYRVKNSNGSYLTLVGNGGTYTLSNNTLSNFSFTNSLTMTSAANVNTNAGAVFKLTKGSEGAGVFTDFNLSAQTLDIRTTFARIVTDLENYAKDKGETVNINKNLSLVWDGDHSYKIQPVAGSFNLKPSGSDVIMSEGETNASWTLEPVDEAHPFLVNSTMKVGDYNYATLYVDFPFTCLDGMEAFYVTEIKGDVAECNTNGIVRVPAKMPVILKWQGDGAGKIVPINDKDLRDLESYTYATEWKGQIDLYSQTAGATQKTAFNSNTMRVLNKSVIEGEETAVFSQDYSGTYIPSNSAYLNVGETGKPVYVVIFPLELDEKNTDNLYIDSDFDEVHVIRTLKADTWNTFCVPFDMSADEIMAQLGYDAEIKELQSFYVSKDGETLNMTFGDPSSFAITAGKPYMVRVHKAISDFNMSKTNVNTIDDPVLVMNNEGYTLHFQGNYSYLDGKVNDYVPMNAFIISSNKFYFVNSNVTLKGFRAYISASDSKGAPVKALQFGFKEPTAISNINFNGLEDGKVYNLQGIKQNSIQKGVNIINGQKIIR